REGPSQGRAGAIAGLFVSRRVRQPPSVELQQVRRRQGRQDRRVLPEQGNAGVARAPGGYRQSPRREVTAPRRLTRRRRSQFALRNQARSAQYEGNGPCGAKTPHLLDIFVTSQRFSCRKGRWAPDCL